eukprot:scaffold16317_cov32-Tisochrysis_lutea.AAC.1
MGARMSCIHRHRACTTAIARAHSAFEQRLTRWHLLVVASSSTGGATSELGASVGTAKPSLWSRTAARRAVTPALKRSAMRRPAAGRWTTGGLFAIAA